MRKLGLAFALVLILISRAPSADTPKEDEVAKLEKQRCPKPTEFASVFSFGYGADLMPKDDTAFGDLLTKIKEAGFNVVHCTYTDKRLDLCKKHGVKMMVHLLSDEYHVYKTPEKAQALCEKLQKNPDVWGYNIWNDVFRKTGEGRRRDVNNVRKWDPTHPAYCGTYRTDGMSHLANADLMGYYDFHWKRGPEQHFPHLLAYGNWARERDARFYTWLSATSGQAGKGNYNRNLFSTNTGIAFGLKGVLWFLGQDLMDEKTLEWKEAGKDVTKVNKEVMPLAKEIAQLGNPVAVYSTPITKTMNNDPLPASKPTMMPPGMDKSEFPKDFWLQPRGGEFVMGVFKDGEKRDVVFVANNNAYEQQKVSLKPTKALKASLFDRKTGKWAALEANEGVISFALDAGGGEMLRFVE